MNEHDDMDEIERIARDALHARADQVEPSPDAYARLADKVAGAADRPTPWWQSPRLLWLGAAGATAAVVAIALVATFSGDDGDEVATPGLETPTPVIEPTTGPDGTATPEPTEPTEPPAATTPTPTPTLHPTTTPAPIDGQGNVGRPEGVIWPVEEIQPFGEWPDSPETAAQNFVTNIAGWTLPVGDVTFLDPILMIADVELQFTDESGEPFGTSTTVRVVGGFDDNGVANWGVQSARSDRIQVFRVFTLDNEFLVTGDGVGFEGVVEVRLVDANANVAGEGFFTGGSFELAPLEGTVPITENFPGPGFAILFDVGGLGVSPSALTIVPIVLQDLDPPPLGTGPCSAEGLEPPTPDPDLPGQIEATRQAIAAAAIACDWDALGALIDPANFRYSFGGGNDPIKFWQEAEAAIGNEPMRYLVETLKLNWVLDQPPPEADVPDSYIWPDAFPMLWDDVTPDMRDALRPLYDDLDFEGFANIGGFAGFRLAIDEDGIWRYFLSGD